MAFNNNRPAIATLSKRFKEHGKPGEILMDKETGEVQVKCKDGSVISYDYNARFNAHVDTATFNAYNGGVYGKMYNLTLDHLDVPALIDKDTNFITAPQTIKSGAYKKFMISIDAETINPSEGLSTYDTETLVEARLTYTKNGTSTRKTITGSINNINKTIFTYDNLGDTPILEYVSFIDGTTLDGDEKLILHSILITVD